MNIKNKLLDDLEFVESKDSTLTYTPSAFSESLRLIDDFNEMPPSVKPALYRLPQDHPDNNNYGIITEHDLD